MSALALLMSLLAAATAAEVSVTASPLRLLLDGVAQVTAEVELNHEPLSVAGVGGAGRTEGSPVLLAGAQGRYYARGDFRRGVPVSLEVLAVHRPFVPGARDWTSNTLRFSPTVGYKWSTKRGFSIEGTGGLSVSWSRSVADDGARQSEAWLSPLVNINLGWSF